MIPSGEESIVPSWLNRFPLVGGGFLERTPERIDYSYNVPPTVIKSSRLIDKDNIQSEVTIKLWSQICPQVVLSFVMEEAQFVQTLVNAGIYEIPITHASKKRRI